MSNAVIINRVNKAVIQHRLDCCDLQTFQYASCLSLHCFAIQPSRANPHPVWSWICPAKVLAESGLHLVIWLCHWWRPSIILCFSCRCVFAVSIQSLRSSSALVHWRIAHSAEHLKMWSLSSTWHEHWGHFNWVHRPHRFIFLPLGKNLAANLDTHCCFDKSNLFIAFSTNSQSISCVACGANHFVVAQWFRRILPLRCQCNAAERCLII